MVTRRGLALLTFLLAVAGCGESTPPPAASGSPATPEASTAAPAPPPQATTASAADRCAALRGTVVAAAQIAQATMVPASGPTPAYCRVEGRIASRIGFVINLPDDWQGRLVYLGGAGFDGSILGPDTEALDKRWASVASDGGHRGHAVDATWALGDPEAVELFGSGSVPTVMASAVPLVSSYYGQAPQKSYFRGCSNGGREALMAAQRSPQLFDGIIAMAPAYNFTGLAVAYNRTAKALLTPPTRFPASKLTLLSNAVLAACDAADGLPDGIVSNPQACRFDPAVLRCAGGDGPDCLDERQLGIVASMMADTTLADGTLMNRGWPLSGNEAHPKSWPTWVVGDLARLPPEVPAQFVFQESGLRFLITGNPLLNTLEFDPQAHRADLDRAAARLDATDPDLSAFRTRGGRLILWHGSADAAISVNGTIDYYRRASAASGSQASADAFMRLYVAPGVAHCFDGPGADRSDLLAALDAWVVQAAPPGALTAIRSTAGTTPMSRPLCPWPQYPRYLGSGDPAAAESFACSPP